MVDRHLCQKLLIVDMARASAGTILCNLTMHVFEVFENVFECHAAGFVRQLVAPLAVSQNRFGEISMFHSFAT